MGTSLFNYSVNIVGFKTDEHLYGMTCAWAMQIDYQKIALLMGQQSVTASKIKSGDIIGVSCLNQNQKNIALQLGENHSDKVNKFINIDYYLANTAVLITNATVNMVVKVTQIIHLPDAPDDYFVCGEVQKLRKGRYHI